MDELDDQFLTLVISSARIEQWLATLRAFKAGGASLLRARIALREMVDALASEAYADEVGAGCWVPAKRAVREQHWGGECCEEGQSMPAAKGPRPAHSLPLAQARRAGAVPLLTSLLKRTGEASPALPDACKPPALLANAHLPTPLDRRRCGLPIHLAYPPCLPAAQMTRSC